MRSKILSALALTSWVLILGVAGGVEVGSIGLLAGGVSMAVLLAVGVVLAQGAGFFG